MTAKTESSNLVLIASPQGSMEGFVKDILKDLTDCQYHRVENLEAFIETPPEIPRPMMAVVDGTLGTQVCSEWIQTMKMNYECPIVVLHNSNISLDFSALKKNGADQIIHMYYDQEFIIDLILEVVPFEFGKNVPLIALNSLSTEELHPDMELNFDVFIHLPGNNKTILLRRKGSLVEEKTIDKFENKKQNFYFKKTESKEFLEYARTSLTLKDSDKNIAITEKLLKSKKVIFEIMSEFFNGEVNNYEVGRQIYDRCKKIIQEYDLTKTYTPEEAFDYIVLLTNNARTLYQDAINVAVFSALLGYCLEVKQEEIELLAVIGLLHNIGLSKLPSYKPGLDLKSLTKEELETYYNYPLASVNMVKGKKVPLPPEVSDSILQHMENVDSTGFPNKLNGNGIHVYAKIVRLAHRIQELTSLESGQSKIAGRDVFNFLKNEAMGGKSPHDMTMVLNLAKKLTVKAA